MTMANENLLSPQLVSKFANHPILSTICLLFLLSIGSQTIYNVYFHPLSKFPGPLLARSSLLWRCWHTLRGRSHRAIQAQHEKYGSVFRVSPNELSFSSVSSWKAIYGPPSANQPQLVKSEFYDTFGGGFKEPCIGSERRPAVHARKKRYLAAAFSSQALHSQEAIVQRCWNKFIEKVGPVSQEDPKGVNVVDWFEMAAFDMLGEMAFGESFGCIESGKHHFWLDLILKHLFEVTLLDNLGRFPLLDAVSRYVLPWLTTRVRSKHQRYSREKVQKRLDARDAGHDFLTRLVSGVESGEVSQEEITAHASTLIIAGGETTAHTLASATYYLLKTPNALKKLAEEVRSHYQSYEDIDANTALQLPYLRAVIDEALRIHPSGAQGFPRISPGIVIDGHYVPVGVEVYTSAWSVVHDPGNFHEPMIFKPERWLDKNCTDVKEASQPFSLGYRACIGRNFAWMEMTICLAKLIFKYDWELLDPDLDWEAASRCFVMWWKAPIPVRFTERVR
ncbi:cytochrome protein [Xylaria curta]|nr:cytochrome protein [Xylaria curta]